MYSIRKIACLLLPLVIVNCSLHAYLDYQQELVISTYQEEKTNKLLYAFLLATEGDPDIVIVDVRHEQEKQDANPTRYDAIVTCYVSNLDEDILRNQEKMVQFMNGGGASDQRPKCFWEGLGILDLPLDQ